ncbi:MAG: outer membrane beta-barrel protein, partial [Planctomycetota bacterium]
METQKMKWSKLALLSAICTGATLATVGATANAQNYGGIQQVNHQTGCTTCGEPVCGCETPCGVPQCDDGGCDSCGEPACGCEPSCGFDNGCGVLDPTCGCEIGCDSGCHLGLGGMNCTDDPFQLFGDLGNNLSAGGWVQLGYHSDGAANGLRFNTRPDELQLQQSWLYVQKELDTSCGFDIGGRFDYVYGTDAPNTQAFGIANNHWDNQWDNGNDYGHAIPQVYGEVGYGDVSVKLGKFYTTIGYEVVTAPDNFFYSHAYTFNNTEPFTHTGALATYDAGNGYSVWGGYVFGWDSGFEDNGDSFLGGASVDLTDDVTLIYSLVGGRFN